MSHLAQTQRNLQAHVIDGDDAIAKIIEDSSATSTATRLRIYSDAYRLRLIEALEANYPLLAQLMGEHAFAHLTQLYLAAHPSRHYSIRWFGDCLAEFIADFPEYRQQPWLLELAMWEWKIAAAFDARDANVLTIEQLASVAPDAWPDLQFALHPSVQRITLSTNVVAIAQVAADDASLPRPGTQAKSDWLIWRQDLAVQYRSLDAVETAAIDAIIAGATFGGLCEILVTLGEDEDQVPLIAAGLLKRWIAEQCLAQS